jgi:hypothetical protein
MQLCQKGVSGRYSSVPSIRMRSSVLDIVEEDSLYVAIHEMH